MFFILVLTMRTRSSAWLHNLQMNNMGLVVFTTFSGFWLSWMYREWVHTRFLVCRYWRHCCFS